MGDLVPFSSSNYLRFVDSSTVHDRSATLYVGGVCGGAGDRDFEIITPDCCRFSSPLQFMPVLPRTGVTLLYPTSKPCFGTQVLGGYCGFMGFSVSHAMSPGYATVCTWSLKWQVYIASRHNGRQQNCAAQYRGDTVTDSLSPPTSLPTPPLPSRWC